MRRVLVTGAAGFIGRGLCPALAAAGWTVRAALRRPAVEGLAGAEPVVVGEIGPDTDWRAALAESDAVIHLAARVHVMRETAPDALAAFRRVNTAGTERLARQSAAAGVRRLILVSSIKVNGERTGGERTGGERTGGERTGDTPFTPDDPPAPADPYGVSKHEAEQALLATATATGLEAVVVRPPLVYGPGVGGNFAALLRLVDRGIPLPLASVANRRSLVGRTNLADLLIRCLDHPAAAGRVFLAADGSEWSTPALIRALARALGRPARLLPCPPLLLRLAGRVTGRGAAVGRLCESLWIDGSAARTALGWQPPLPPEDELARTATWYREHPVPARSRL